jgi:hypothetical protein
MADNFTSVVDAIKGLMHPNKLVESIITIPLPAVAEYTAGDVLAATATNTNGRCWFFDKLARVKGGGFYIVKATVNSQSESVTPRIALQLYSQEAVGERDDNDAAASPQPGDGTFFKGEIPLPAMLSRGDNSYTVATPGTYGNLPYPFVCHPTSRGIYIIVITLDTFTQTASDTLEIQIISDQY